MAEAGVITIPGSAFGEAGRGFLRLSYSQPDDVLDEALGRLDDWAQRRVTPRP